MLVLDRCIAGLYNIRVVNIQRPLKDVCFDVSRRSSSASMKIGRGLLRAFALYNDSRRNLMSRR